MIPHEASIDTLVKLTAIAQSDCRFEDSAKHQSELDRQGITVLSNVEGWVGWHQEDDSCVHFLRYTESPYPLPAMNGYIPKRIKHNLSVEQLLQQRWTAKQNRDYETADRLRSQVEQVTGCRVVDLKDKSILVEKQR